MLGSAQDIMTVWPDWAKGQPYTYQKARLFFVNVPAGMDLVDGKDANIPDPGAKVDESLAFKDRSVMALWRKCPHLGCQIPPLCEKSDWFECLCHGSKYTILSEKRDGPAPRGHGSLPGLGRELWRLYRRHRQDGQRTARGHRHLRPADGGRPDRQALRRLSQCGSRRSGSSWSSALALFTMLYWLTDSARLSTRQTSAEEAQLAFAKEVFANNPGDPSAAGCARCHGDDGMGGPVPGQPGLNAPNLHSPSIANKLKVNPDYVNLVIRFGGVVVSGNVSSHHAGLEHGGWRSVHRAADRRAHRARHRLGQGERQRQPDARRPTRPRRASRSTTRSAA